MTWHLGPVLRGIRGHRIAALLVATQFAVGLSIAVLSVLIGDYFAGTRDDPAMASADGLAIIEVQLAGPDLASRRAAVLAELRGVGPATVVDRLPLHTLEPDLDDIAGMQVAAYDAGPDIAAVAGVRLIAGRDLVAADLDTGITVATIVSPALAAKLPLGTRFQSRARGPAVVVGVADLRSHLFGEDELVAIYGADDPSSPRLTVLARGPRTIGQRPGQHAVITPLLDVLAHRTKPVSSVLLILAATVGMILLVVLMGSMGLTYYLISTRMREIGLRRAMGASRGDIARHFLLESALLTLAGAVAGMLVVLAVLPLLHEQEGFTVRWSLVAVTVAAVVLLNLVAALVPARKAASVPPVVASRT